MESDGGIGSERLRAGWAVRTQDLILVGGGLANGLLAFRLKQRRPDLRVLLLEKENRLGGQHTWSFHSADLRPSDWKWIAPLVSRSWETQTVIFPEFQRELSCGYHCIRSDRFHDVVSATLENQVVLGASVTNLTPDGVELSDGRRYAATCVVDGRGFRPVRREAVAYQKFLGLDVTLAAPHGLTGPLIMDATVEQEDGFRFFYCLPWTERSLLIEDTRYSDTPDLSRAEFRAEILAYAERRGWRIASVEREESEPCPFHSKPFRRFPTMVKSPLWEHAWTFFIPRRDIRFRTRFGSRSFFAALGRSSPRFGGRRWSGIAEKRVPPARSFAC